MVSPSSPPSERRGQQTSAAQLAVRIDSLERQQRQLRNTMNALAREAGLSVGSPCFRCDQCYMLLKNGMMYCPKCGYRQYL